MVKSEFLTPEHLIRALRAGDFYASSGVSLSRIEFDTEAGDYGTLHIDVHPENEANFKIQFIGSLKDSDGFTGGNGISDSEQGRVEDESAIGVVLQETKGNTASYALTGRELYVRAVVHSSVEHSDPSLANQKQQAWTQPIGWEKDFSSN